MSAQHADKQPEHPQPCFFDLPPELRQIVYTEVFNSTRYPAQAYYPLFHSHQTPIWRLLDQRDRDYSREMSQVWENFNHNHGFAYSLHVRRRLAAKYIPLLKTSRLIRAEALPLLDKVLSPPLAIWRDIGIEARHQSANFLSRVTKCLQNAGVQPSNITTLQLHSEMVCSTAESLVAWAARDLPSLRTVDIVIDALRWEYRSLWKRDKATEAVMHQDEGVLSVYGFPHLAWSLAPLAMLAQSVAELTFTIVAPEGGYCACYTPPRRDRKRKKARQATHYCEASPYVDGPSYRYLLWVLLQRLVVVMEMTWFAVLKGAQRQCSWQQIFHWVAGKLKEREFVLDARLVNMEGRLDVGKCDASRLDPAWLRTMTGRRAESLKEADRRIVMGSAAGQKFGWVTTNYTVEFR